MDHHESQIHTRPGGKQAEDLQSSRTIVVHETSLDSFTGAPKFIADKSISTGAPKMALKTLSDSFLGLGAKLVYHRRPQNRAGASRSPKK
jgi:hypothetical protein